MSLKNFTEVVTLLCCRVRQQKPSHQAKAVIQTKPNYVLESQIHIMS